MEKTDKIEKRFYNIQEFQALFGLGYKKAVALCRLENFPAIKNAPTAVEAFFCCRNGALKFFR